MPHDSAGPSDGLPGLTQVKARIAAIRLDEPRSCEGFPVTLVSGDKARLRRARSLGGWVRGIVARWRPWNRLRGINRAEFEQVASDLDLSHPELYGLLIGRSVSAELTEQNLAALEVSRERIRAAQALEAKRSSARVQALLPIGPSCC